MYLANGGWRKTRKKLFKSKRKRIGDASVSVLVKTRREMSHIGAACNPAATTPTPTPTPIQPTANDVMQLRLETTICQ
ncbi:uncharacterized protein Dana_GF26472 [Drosophila ananassae]|uniref:Uncharacterized protein n=1 Tax=Drosophila ananassae TaxID=7217 RepID=A0A0P8Y2S2_DROAN|nr:uncharacterized protein Dana_GF26472 [Drosophila ananassae]